MAKKANPKSLPSASKMIENYERRVARAYTAVSELPIKQIVIGRFNPRQNFPPEEIRELAETIATHGLLQPIVVRPSGRTGKYSLVAGERRFRACKLLKHQTVPATVIEADDSEARELAAVENLHRKNLNPIEEAHAFHQLTANGATETEVAERLKISQGQVSNRMRLLKLPEAIQARVISGEILASLARDIVPYAKYPQLMRAIEKELGKPKPGQPMDREDFGLAVDRALRRNTRGISGKYWDGKAGRNVPHFQPSEEQRAQLGIVLTDAYGTNVNGDLLEAATNTKLWDKLQEAYRKEWLAKQDAKSEGKQAKGKGNKGKKKEPAKKKLTAAQQERIHAEEREKQKRQAEQFKKRLAEWRTNWRRYLVAEQIGLGMDQLGHANACRMLLCAAAAWKIDTWYSRTAPLEQALAKRVKLRGGRGNALWAGVAALQDGSDVEELTIEFLQLCFWQGDDQGPSELVPAEDVEAVAGHLGIDFAARWREEQAGPLSEAFWNLHNKDQLVKLGSELGAPVSGAKAAMVRTLLECEELPLPKELVGKKKK